VSRIETFFPGAQPSTGYGLTEISSIGTAIAGIDYQRKPQSVGLAAPVVDIKIVGEDGRDLPAGEAGEIWIKGPNVMKGYWNLPEATAEVITDGWMHSGDLGYMDEEGFVFLAGRINEMIIRGGENVYCAEVERALFSLDAVIDVAVFGMPDRVLGEEVAAVVQLRPGSELTAAQLRAHVVTRVAGYKVPALIELREEPLIRNAAGKIMKGELKKKFLGQRVDKINMKSSL
jgi:long-chain acyl-CoA synthetase